MHWALTASQFLRAMRGKRSQLAVSRRLGYRSNVSCDWEAGRRFPTAARTMRNCEVLRLPVEAAFEAFQPACLPALREGKRFTLGLWLDALRGGTSVATLARRTGYSRYAIGRWLCERAEPRLPAFLHLVEAITGRVSDLVGTLVPIEEVPELLAGHRRRAAAKRLAFDLPWTEAVLRVIETEGYQRGSSHEPGVIARRLGISMAEEAAALRGLEQAGVVNLSKGRYGDVHALSIDMTASPQDLQKLKTHWAQVSLQRIAAPQPGDWLGYNVISISEADLERARDLMRKAFREIRALTAASSPVEVVALLNMQLISWPEP